MPIPKEKRRKIKRLALEGKTLMEISKLMKVSCKMVAAIRKEAFAPVKKVYQKVKYKRVESYVCKGCKEAGKNPNTNLDPCPACAVRKHL